VANIKKRKKEEKKEKEGMSLVIPPKITLHVKQ
jgi:hypothetical protein